MKNAFALVMFLAFTISSFGQSENSIHLNGGLIIPLSGHVGPAAGLEYSRSLSDVFELYFSGGYYKWNRNEIAIYGFEKSLTTYSEDNHNLYSVYSGTRINLSTIKTFKIFATAEFGYNHLSYNSYQNTGTTDETTGRITEIHVDENSKKELDEDLLGLGFGLGFSHRLSEKFSFLVEYKRNLMTSNFENFRNFFILNAGLIFDI